MPSSINLADVLRGVVNLQEFGGWQNYARPGGFAPLGIIIHHTGGRNDLNVVINGRSDLPGPLSNLYFDRDAPFRATLISGGRCNHAGSGSSTVLAEARDGKVAGPDAAARGLQDDTSGNYWFYGFECENTGTGAESWPSEQYTSMVRAAAAICKAHGWTAGHIVGHREWTRRKPDPRGFSMNDFRSAVAAQIAEWSSPPPPAPAPDPLLEKLMSLPTLTEGAGAGDRTNQNYYVRLLQGLMLANEATPVSDVGTITGQFSNITKASLARWQAAVGLTADGVCGPKTWVRLHG